MQDTLTYLGTDGVFHGVTLAVNDVHRLSSFYVDHLSMKQRDVVGGVELFFDSDACILRLEQAEVSCPYASSPRDRYWKIGITLPDLDAAYQYLTSRGVGVSRPHQFENIGYMSHMTDPEEFQIELLQHTFAGQAKTVQADPDAPFSEAEIGQVTLRTTNLERDLKRFHSENGMRLLSVQRLTHYGFDLYFLAKTVEKPPLSDLEAVENRPWLWQRSYVTLELQHIHESDVPLKIPPKGQVGYQGLLFR